MKRAAWLCIAAFLFAACGSPSPRSAEREPSPGRNELADQVAAATAGLGTARTFGTQTMVFDQSAGGGKVTTTTAGLIDFDRQLQSALMTARGQGRQGKAMAQQMGTSELIGDGLILYMKSPIFQQIPDVKEWVKMDIEAIGKEMGLDLGSLMQVNQNDPTATLQYMHGLDDIEELGQEKVRGVTTTHYRGTGTFEKLKDVLGPDAGPTLDKLQEMLGVEGFTLDAWVDDDDVARRVEVDYDALPIPGMSGSWSVMMEFYDFGVNVDVDIPPKHQVTDMLQLMKEQQATAS